MTPKISIETHTAHSLLKTCVEQISDTIEQNHAINKQQFINTHFQYLDDKILGLEFSTLTILAGASASGKTNLMLSIAQQMGTSNYPKFCSIFIEITLFNKKHYVFSSLIYDF